MTLIYGYKIPSTTPELGTGIIVAGDSIATSNYLPEENLYQAFGTNSQNQELGPLTDEFGIKYFTESACKIGKLNEKVLLSVCGDSSLIYLIIEQFFMKSDKFKSCENFSNIHLKNIFKSIEPLENIAPHTVAEILFCIFDSGSITFVDLRCKVDESKTIQYELIFSLPRKISPLGLKALTIINLPLLIELYMKNGKHSMLTAVFSKLMR